MNEQDYLEAMAIIGTSIKIGRPLFQFKRWDKLDFDAKMKALKDSFEVCYRCYKKRHISLLREENNPFGTFYECIKKCKVVLLSIEQVRNVYE